MTNLALVEDRTQFIGGSEVGAILGVDPYKTRLQVYEEKVGLAPSFEGNAHTKRGTRLEEVAAEEYMEKHGVKLVRVNQRIQNPRYPFITAKIDRRIIGVRKLVEFKCPSLGSYSKIKREGLHEGYIAQMQSYLGTVEYEAGDWGIFCADLWDLIDFEVALDMKLVTDIEKQLASFWIDHVLKRVPPPPVEADEERIEIARAEGTQKRVEVQDPMLAEALRDLRDAKKLAKDAEQIEENAKARIISELGEDAFAVYVAPGVKLNWYQQKGRTSFDRKALAGARPLDRLAVGAALMPLYENPHVISTAELEAAIAKIGQCDIDLTQFDRIGKPFGVMRVTDGDK